MAQFPEKESEITVLAQGITAGLTASTEVFPSPPISPEALQERIAEYIAARDEARAQ